MAETTAYTLMPEPNISYLVKTKDVIISAEPLSASTMGLMMMLSTFQYQAPTVNPAYSNALSQAAKAAFIESGGQAFQDKAKGYATNQGKNIIHGLGVNDTELGVVFGSAKVIRDRQIDVNGPHLLSAKTHVTVGVGHESLGLTWEWK